MPRRLHAPIQDLSSCQGCPWLRKSGTVPVKQHIVPGAQCVVVLDRPSQDDRLGDKPFSSRLGRIFTHMLASRGLTKYSVLYRTSCKAHPHRQSDSFKGKAAKSCLSRFNRVWEIANPHGDLPTLFLGKHSHIGVLGKSVVNFYSGESPKISVAKLATNMIYENCMVCQHPSIALWGGAAEMLPDLEPALNRFAAYVASHKTFPKPPVILHPNDDALALMRRMGQLIALDVETLGIEPGCPITCVGVSDGTHTVSLPWDDYYTSVQGNVTGIVKATTGTQQQCKAEFLRLLSSGRRITGQNVKYDEKALAGRGIQFKAQDDTMLAAKIIWPAARAGLEILAARCIPELPALWKKIFLRGDDDDAKGIDTYSDSKENSLREYNGLDTWATARVQLNLDGHLDVED